MRSLVVAIMTLVSFRPATLQEVVSQSRWIVVAERVKDKWRALETLRAPDPSPAPGLFTVLGPNQGFNEMMTKHLAEHGWQGAPSPIFPRYPSSLSEEKFAKAKRAILFLKPWKNDWELTMEGAWESPQKRDLVKSALK